MTNIEVVPTRTEARVRTEYSVKRLDQALASLDNVQLVFGERHVGSGYGVTARRKVSESTT